MTLFTLFAGAAFAGLIAWAAIADLHSYRIPNAVSVGLVILFLLTGLTLGVPWLTHLAAGAITLGVGLIVYRFGSVGGGDVKLIAAVALWAGGDWRVFLLALSIATMVYALSVMAARKLIAAPAMAAIPAARWPRMFRTGEQLPFGVSIAIAAMFTIAGSPLLGVA